MQNHTADSILQWGRSGLAPENGHVAEGLTIPYALQWGRRRLAPENLVTDCTITHMYELQ